MTDLPLETGTEYKNPGVTNAEYFNGIKKTSQTYWSIDGYPVNTKIYRDYALMHNAALKEGIKLTLASGFRSPDEQQLLRNNLLLENITKDGETWVLINLDTLKNQILDTKAIYKSIDGLQKFEEDTSRINGNGIKSYSNPGVYYANSVAKPGTSKHGDGLALDFKIGSRSKPERPLNTKTYIWLVLNSWKYGFVRNVDDEEWHFLYKRTNKEFSETFPNDTSHENGGPYAGGLGGFGDHEKLNRHLFYEDLFLNDLVYNPETNEYISQRKIPMESITPISPSLTPTIPLDDGLQGIQPVNAPSSNFEFKTRQRNR
jgi:hypothetical protein